MHVLKLTEVSLNVPGVFVPFLNHWVTEFRKYIFLKA